MKVSEQTLQQLERFFKKIAQKFPTNEETSLVTDIHVFLSPDSGEMIASDDDGTEITRCVVEQWIENIDEHFYAEASKAMRACCETLRPVLEALGIMKPYSIVLENEDNENIAELFLADNDTIIIGGDLMDGLDQDLDRFLDKLLAEGEQDMKKGVCQNRS
mgnify:FL=1